MRIHSNAILSSMSSTIFYTFWASAMLSLYLDVVPSPFYVNAQVPENDLCINARPITTVSSRPVRTKFNTTYSTSDLYVVDECLGGRSPKKAFGIWFNFTGNGGNIFAQACTTVGIYEANISIFTGGCNPSARQCVAATRNACKQGRIIFETILGTKYHVLVQSPRLGSSIDLTLFSNPPPALHDRCVDALPVVIGSSRFPITFNATYATSDLDVVDNCFPKNTTRYPGIWLNFTGTGERMELKTEKIKRYTCGDSYISIFSGGCDPSTLQCVAARQDKCDFRNRFFFETTLGTIYHALVQTPYNNEVSVSVFAAAPARNDQCVNARPITIGSRPAPIIFNTSYTTRDLDVVDDCLSGRRPTYPGVWFNFTGTGSSIVAKACEQSYIYNTFISIYTGGCNPSARQCVAATLYACEKEILVFKTTLGTKYHALVQSYVLDSHDSGVELSFFSAPPAPANDLCINAQPLTIGSSPVPLKFNTTYASADLDVTDNCLIDGGPKKHRGIWFNFTGTGRRVTIEACENTDDSTIISIFTGGCNPAARQCVAATSAGCGPEIFFIVTKRGTAYHALVQMRRSPIPLDSSVELSIFSSPTVENDLCINAQPIIIGTSLVPIKSSTIYATKDSNVVDECLRGNRPAAPGIWYNFTGTGGSIVVQACNMFYVSGYSTYISIFTGGCNISARQCVTATFDGCGRGRMIFETSLGTIYHVLVQTPHVQKRYSSVAVSILSAPPAPHDLCENALPVVIGKSRFPIAFNTTYATSDLDLSDNCFAKSPRYPGIWLNFTGTGGRVELKFEGGRFECGYPYPYMSVFSGGCNLSTLQCVAARRYYCDDPTIEFLLRPQLELFIMFLFKRLTAMRFQCQSSMLLPSSTINVSMQYLSL